MSYAMNTHSRRDLYESYDRFIPPIIKYYIHSILLNRLERTVFNSISLLDTHLERIVYVDCTSDNSAYEVECFCKRDLIRLATMDATSKTLRYVISSSGCEIDCRSSFSIRCLNVVRSILDRNVRHCYIVINKVVCRPITNIIKMIRSNTATVSNIEFI